MKKRHLSSVFIFVISATLITSVYFLLCGAPAEQLSQKTVERISPSIVMIVWDQGVIGTGTLLDSNTILTAKHLLRPSQRYGIRFYDATLGWASASTLSPHADLALMKLESPSEKMDYYPHSIASFRDISREFPVIAWWTSINTQSLAVHRGTILQIHQTLEVNSAVFSDLFLTDIPFQSWYSGWPLMTLWGEIIGVHTAYEPAGEYGWSTPVNTEIIRELQSKE